MRTVLAAVFAITLPMQNTVADEIKLRCDPVSGSSEPFVVSIDMLAETVHMDTDDQRRWYRNNTELSPKGDQELNSIFNFDRCPLHWKQYVKIDVATIRYGDFGTNVTRCDADAGYNPGTLARARRYTINRVTGIFTRVMVDARDGYNIELDLPTLPPYQCQKFTGNAF